MPVCQMSVCNVTFEIDATGALCNGMAGVTDLMPIAYYLCATKRVDASCTIWLVAEW